VADRSGGGNRSRLVGARPGSIRSDPFVSGRTPTPAGGSGFFGGSIDYFNLINASGGINGVKITWEECETEYNASRGVECYERLKKNKGGASFVEPLSTGIAYGILDRVADDKISMTNAGLRALRRGERPGVPVGVPADHQLLGRRRRHDQVPRRQERGLDKLKGKKIVHLYHDSAFGKEPFPSLRGVRKELGFELIKIAVPHPGNEQQSQWLQIRQANPDYVILWGWGVMNPTALKTAARVGYPREKMLGVWWSGLRGRRGSGRRRGEGLHVDDVQHAGQLSGARPDPAEGLRRQQGQPRGQVADRFRLSHARRHRGDPVDRGDPQGAGEVRQGQGDETPRRSAGDSRT
jgi:hypothetical protein